MWHQIPYPPDACASGTAGEPSGETVRLEGSALRYEADARTGRGIALEHLRTGTGFLRPGSAGVGFRLLDREGRWLDGAALESEPQVELDREAGELRVLHERPRQEGEEWPIRLLLRVQLHGEDALAFSFELEHLGGELVVERVHYPVFSGLWEFAGEATQLMLPFIGGERRPAPVSARYSDFEYIYPNEALSFMDLYAPTEGLYLASYDEAFRWTVLRGRCLEERAELELLFESTPFLRAGEHFASQPFVAAVHEGDWHSAAERYREEWLSTWWAPPETPARVKELRGLIELFFEFTDTKRTHRHAPEELMAFLLRCRDELGLDIAHVCGFHEGGFDAQYPLYEPLASLGGAAGLRAFFSRCNAVEGVTTDIYLNCRLMETGTPWYERVGRGWACTTRSGEVFTERYNGRLFAIACPAVRERREFWYAKVAELLGHGSEGLQVDQPHTTARECWSYEQHGHSTPFDHWGPAYVELFGEMRERMRLNNPESWSWGEAASDLFAQFFDISCCYTRFPDQRVAFGETDPETRDWTYDWRGFGAPEVFRYVCPEIPLLQAPPAKWEDAEESFARLNLMWVFSAIIYWQGVAIDYDMDAVPAGFKSYLKALWDLRHEQREVLVHGRFIDDRGLEELPAEIYAKRYTADGIEAVVAINRSREEELLVEVALAMDDEDESAWRHESCSIDEAGIRRSAGRGWRAPVTLAPNRAGLLVWRRDEAGGQ